VAHVASIERFLTALRKSGLLSADQIDAQLAERQPGDADLARLARRFVQAGLLTMFQANYLAQGKWRNLIVANKYKILDRLGAGGMGQVFLAEHLLMKRQVALKSLPTARLKDAATVERFLREAQALAALDHVNIVRAYDLDRLGDVYLLVMEYVDGPNLRDLVADHGPRPVGQAAHYITQAAQGLQHAHEAGWVHRDIKPANLLVDPAGVVKVLDLGLAILMGDDAESLTRKFDDKSILGTADFLAPEQAVDSHAVDIRADVYSLGATLYYLLSGQPPFAAATVAQKLVSHHLREPTPIRAVRPEAPKELAAVIARMMAKKPVHRYQEPAAVVEALRPFATDADPALSRTLTRRRRSTEPSLASTLSGRSPSGRTIPGLGTLPWRARSWPVKAAVLAALAVVAGGGGLLWLGFRGRPAAGTGPDAARTNALGAFDPTASKAAPRASRGAPAAVSAVERQHIPAHQGPAECVRVLADGQRLVTVGADRAVRLWDLATGRKLLQLDGHTDAVRCVALLPDGGRALTASRDGTVRLWDLNRGAELREFRGDRQEVWWVDPAPDGRRMLSCGKDKTIHLWNIESGAELRQLLGHTDLVTAVAFLPDGRHAVSCGLDKTACLWDVEAGQKLKSITLPDVAYRVTLSADGHRVAIGNRSGVHVWDLKADRVSVYEALNGSVNLEEGRFSPDGRWLLAGGMDGSVRVWDAESRQEMLAVTPVKEKVLEVVWFPKGHSFLTAGDDGAVRVWDFWSE
jgi:serine/threonine protein kinase/WD40 repeat protein